jgi:hypothetical protein
VKVILVLAELLVIIVSAITFMQGPEYWWAIIPFIVGVLSLVYSDALWNE